MKKTITSILAICALALTSTTVNAQNTSIGVNAGYQVGSFETFDYSKVNHGYRVGVTGIYSARSSWGLGLDLALSNAGGEYSVMNTPMDRMDTYNVSNTSINVTPKGYLFFGDLEDNFRPNIFIGPSVGFLVNSESEQDFDRKDDFKTVSLGGVLGAGFNYRLAPSVWLSADASWNAGFTTIDAVEMETPIHPRNNSLGLNVGLVFGLNKIK